MSKINVGVAALVISGVAAYLLSQRKPAGERGRRGRGEVTSPLRGEPRPKVESLDGVGPFDKRAHAVRPYRAGLVEPRCRVFG